jgi:hypothetical protein
MIEYQLAFYLIYQGIQRADHRNKKDRLFSTISSLVLRAFQRDLPPVIVTLQARLWRVIIHHNPIGFFDDFRRSEVTETQK